MHPFLTRFAPSPTGHLHLGHAASAFHVWAAARRIGANVLLRIEDIDTTRCRPEYTKAIFEDLAWLGLEWSKPVRIQSEHFDAYADCVGVLAEQGLAYRCFRTRGELSAFPAPYIGGPLPVSEELARLNRGEPYAWRLSLRAVESVLQADWNELNYTVRTDTGPETRKANPSLHGDIVIARKDSPSAYHLAATYDDALQGITHIIRGKDLIDAPHIHTLLQVLMGWPQPIYHHHALIKGPDGKRLSKTDKSQSLASLRESGMTPEMIKQSLGFHDI